MCLDQNSLRLSICPLHSDGFFLQIHLIAFKSAFVVKVTPFTYGCKMQGNGKKQKMGAVILIKLAEHQNGSRQVRQNNDHHNHRSKSGKFGGLGKSANNDQKGKKKIKDRKNEILTRKI